MYPIHVNGKEKTPGHFTIIVRQSEGGDLRGRQFFKVASVF